MPRIRRRITWNYLLDVHGGKIGLACAALSVAVTLWGTVQLIDRAIAHELDHGRRVVAAGVR